MTAPAQWSAMVRRAGEAAAMTLPAVAENGPTGVADALALVYGELDQAAAGMVLVELLSTLSLAVATLGELTQKSATHVVEELVASAVIAEMAAGESN